MARNKDVSQDAQDQETESLEACLEVELLACEDALEGLLRKRNVSVDELKESLMKLSGIFVCGIGVHLALSAIRRSSSPRLLTIHTINETVKSVDGAQLCVRCTLYK
eukprot:TRINITY_DN64447_c0_g1_i1.p1 TRINITY_DN64447_c0_g1~~TRINITY_DN64447_c0_g1_i1.p1  ORF type:complete len:107 (+),score=7.05 TRINITY_DN64447_c0_g1_i1:140-460(+)